VRESRSVTRPRLAVPPRRALGRYHWELNPFSRRGLDRARVASVGVARNTDAGVVRQHAFESHAHLRRAISHDHLAGVKRIPDPDPTAVVARHPTRRERRSSRVALASPQEPLPALVAVAAVRADLRQRAARRRLRVVRRVTARARAQLHRVLVGLTVARAPNGTARTVSGLAVAALQRRAVPVERVVPTAAVVVARMLGQPSQAASAQTA